MITTTRAHLANNHCMLPTTMSSWNLFGLVASLYVTGIVLAAMSLLYRIFFPTILPYPWPPSPSPEQDRRRTVVLAGSFNPPHKGHVAMIDYLSRRYGKVIVAIGVNPTKQYAVTPDQRATLLRKCIDDADNVTVQTVPGYIWRHLPQASLFVRGLRSQQDIADERRLLLLNTWGPLLLGPLWWPKPTLFLQAVPHYAPISSTIIRDACRQNNTAQLQDWVPAAIVEDVRQLYG